MDTYLVLQANYVDKQKYVNYHCDDCAQEFCDYFDDDIYKVYRTHETLYFCNDYHCFHNYTHDKNVKYLVTPRM